MDNSSIFSSILLYVYLRFHCMPVLLNFWFAHVWYFENERFGISYSHILYMRGMDFQLRMYYFSKYQSMTFERQSNILEILKFLWELTIDVLGLWLQVFKYSKFTVLDWTRKYFIRSVGIYMTIIIVFFFNKQSNIIDWIPSENKIETHILIEVNLLFDYL